VFRSIFVKSAFAAAAALISGTAMAACHVEGAGTAINSTLALRVGQITVGRDIPVGAEVYRQEFSPGANTSISCTPGPYDITIKRQLSGGSAAPVPGFDFHAGAIVYATNVAGIGVQFRDADNRSLAPISSHPRCQGAQACVTPIEHQLKFIMSFIKVSTQVEAGAISAVNLPTLDISYEFDGQQLPVSRVRLTGQLRVVAQTCQTPPVRVNLGRYGVHELERNGHTDWKDFDIVLNQCPAFHGYYSASGLAVPGNPPGGMFNSNKITFRVDPTLRALSADEGILSLTPHALGEMKAAAGVGVQLAGENAQPIRLSTLLESGILTEPNEGGSYFIRLKARYIKQASGVVRSGPANATATFTINYQ
jgi:type 1 fimbria pilin